MRFQHQPQTPMRDGTSTRALLATPLLFKARRMLQPDDNPRNPLPEELDRALRRATDRTLVALTALRKAVRQHVRDERERGTALAEVELELHEIIARALRDAEGRDSVDRERDTLANQMVKWTAGFYNEND